jgi:hypothetical protein
MAKRPTKKMLSEKQLSTLGVIQSVSLERSLSPLKRKTSTLVAFSAMSKTNPSKFIIMVHIISCFQVAMNKAKQSDGKGGNTSMANYLGIWLP